MATESNPPPLVQKYRLKHEGKGVWAIEKPSQKKGREWQAFLWFTTLQGAVKRLIHLEAGNGANAAQIDDLRGLYQAIETAEKRVLEAVALAGTGTPGQDG